MELVNGEMSEDFVDGVEQTPDDEPEQDASNDGQSEELTVEETISVNIERLSKLPNKKITGWNEHMDDIKSRRDAITVEMAEFKEEVEGEGVVFSMFKAAHKRTHEDRRKQAAMDVSFAKCCSAEDTLVQKDFFNED